MVTEMTWRGVAKVPAEPVRLIRIQSNPSGRAHARIPRAACERRLRLRELGLPLGRAGGASIPCSGRQLAPKAGNAYADEIRRRHEASSAGPVAIGTFGTAAHDLKPSPGCSVRCSGGQPPIDGLTGDVEDFLPPVSVNALRHPRCRIGISDLWSARRRAGEAGFGGAVGGVA